MNLSSYCVKLNVARISFIKMCKPIIFIRNRYCILFCVLIINCHETSKIRSTALGSKKTDFFVKMSNSVCITLQTVRQTPNWIPSSSVAIRDRIPDLHKITVWIKKRNVPKFVLRMGHGRTS